MIERTFKVLRKNIRLSGKPIIDHIIRNNFDPWNSASENDICSFCGSNYNITEEHVLAKWSFENNPNTYYINNINGLKQKFIESHVPACSVCNNVILSKIENYIVSLFREFYKSNKYFEYSQIINMIRWLELIDYKFHLLDFRKKFLINKSYGYEPIFKDVPVTVMRRRIKLSPFKSLSQLRKSQSRLKIRAKDHNFNSLVLFREINAVNNQKLFFHGLDEHIFFLFPEYKIAMFYFFNRAFKSNYHAEEEAQIIIEANYGV